MAANPQVKERSAAQVTVNFLDFADAASDPSSATYEVIDKDTGTILRAEGALVTAVGVATITLTVVDTRIVTDAKSLETHCILVRGDYGTGQEANGDYEFDVVNLKKLSGVP